MFEQNEKRLPRWEFKSSRREEDDGGFTGANADDLTKQLTKAFREFKANHKADLTELEKKVEARLNRAALGAGGPEVMRDRPTTAEQKAWANFLRLGDVGELKAAGMIVTNDPSGGYAAPPSWAAEIREVGAEQGVIRKLAFGYEPRSADFSIPFATNLSGAQWTNETGGRPETTTPDLANVRPPSGGLYAVAPVTNWLLNDSTYDLEAFVRNSLGQQFGVSESAAFVTGDGTGTPLGFLSSPVAATADATRPFGTVEKVPAGSTTDFDIDDLLTLVGKLAPRYRKNAAFVMNTDTETYVRKLKSATTGAYYWQPSTQAGTPPTLLGYPCHVDVNMPAIAANALPVAFADWQRFYAITDIGPQLLLRDPLTKKGYTLFYAERRVGGSVTDSNAGKLLVMS